MNPRYLAYCHAHGEADPVKMSEKNTGCWHPFTQWNRSQMARFTRENNIKVKYGALNIKDSEAYDKWILEQFPAPIH